MRFCVSEPPSLSGMRANLGRLHVEHLLALSWKNPYQKRPSEGVNILSKPNRRQLCLGRPVWQEPYAEFTALAEAVDRAEAKDLAAIWQHVVALAAEWLLCQP